VTGECAITSTATFRVCEGVDALTMRKSKIGKHGKEVAATPSRNLSWIETNLGIARGSYIIVVLVSRKEINN
jgi:hypothetical protein